MGKTNLAPGFRFHPTDVELVRYYLRRKVLGKKLLSNAIAEIDIYKFEPPDLPDKSCLKTGDLKWYFFCPREIKYPKSGKAKRSTQFGYWKTTGKDSDVTYNKEVVGKRKTLVYHYGKTPRGDRTDWIIHEYTLKDKVLELNNVPQDTYVLCVLFKKNGLGPTRPGSHYGAPFKDEDWSDMEEEEEDAENVPGPSKETVLVNTASHSQECIVGVVSCISDVPTLTATSDAVVACSPMPSSSPPPPLLEAPQDPPEDDDFYKMLDLFVVDNDELRHEPGVEEAAVSLGDDEFRGIQDLSNDLFVELQDLIETSTPAQAGTHDGSTSNGQSS